MAAVSGPLDRRDHRGPSHSFIVEIVIAFAGAVSCSPSCASPALEAPKPLQ